MSSTRQGPSRATRLSAEERRRIVLDTATRLFTTHGVHAVGMDRLIAESGLSKMSVYRVFATKDELVGAYLERLAREILGHMDRDTERAADPRASLHSIIDAIERDLRRPGFRGCPFGNAAAEYDDRDHPARQVARRYRQSLLARLENLARGANPDDPDHATRVARRLAVLIDGAYLSSAHLGPDGPGADALALARELIDAPSAR